MIEITQYWRVSYAYNQSRKAWFEFNGTFKQLANMLENDLGDFGVGEMHINPLSNQPTIDRKAAFKPDPEIICAGPSTSELQAQLDMAVTALTSIKNLDPDYERDAEDVAQEAIDIATAALGDAS